MTTYFVISKPAGDKSNAYVKGIHSELEKAEQQKRNMPPLKHMRYHIIKSKDLKKFERKFDCITYV